MKKACAHHPDPETLDAIWCRNCGAYKHNKNSRVRYAPSWYLEKGPGPVSRWSAPASSVRVKCPFCGGEFFASTNLNLGGDDENPGVLHTLPACAEFEAMEVTEFLAAARRRLRQMKSKGESE